jgi:hypothetical protein
MEAHIYNPRYLGDREIGGLWFEVHPGKKLLRPYVKEQTDHVVLSLISAMQKKVGGSQAEVGPRQKHESLSKKYLKLKGLKG